MTFYSSRAQAPALQQFAIIGQREWCSGESRCLPARQKGGQRRRFGGPVGRPLPRDVIPPL
jgi:hypothetical protein